MRKGSCHSSVAALDGIRLAQSWRCVKTEHPQSEAAVVVAAYRTASLEGLTVGAFRVGRCACQPCCRP